MSNQSEFSAHEKAIGSFWSWFVAKGSDLRSPSGDLDSLLDDVLHAIQKIDGRLYVEVCRNKAPCEFIITASGHKELAPRIAHQ